MLTHNKLHKNYHIRKANKKDYQQVMNLFTDFVKQPDRYKSLNNDSFYKFIALPYAYFYVIEHHAKLIGFISFTIRAVVRYSKPIIEVEELYVNSKHRRKKLATKLLDIVNQTAHEQNCQYIFIASSNERIDAHSFYESISFDNYANHFRKLIK